MTTTHAERVTLAVCPPWCAGHTGIYQAWDDDEDAQLRRHGSEGVTVVERGTDDIAVGVSQTEHALEGMVGAPVVELYLTGEHMCLTADEALRLITTLQQAVDQIRISR